MRHFFISLFIVLFTQGIMSFASPVRPFPFAVRQPDGKMLTLNPRGDEYMSYMLTSDGYAVARRGSGYYYVTSWGSDGAVTGDVLAHNVADRGADEKLWLVSHGITSFSASRVYAKSRSRALSSTNAIGQSSSPQGKVIYPVLLVEYKDVKFYFTNPEDTFSRYFNEEGYSYHGASGSVHDYFNDQSLGKYSPEYKIAGRVTLSRNRSYYGAPSGSQHDSHVYDMVKEAVDSARVHGIDFSAYEISTGSVPMIGILFAGEGEQSCSEVTDAVWAAYYPYTVSYGTGRINSFLVTNELTHPYRKDSTGNYVIDYSVSELDGIGTFCHEFSHFLGLPDFYNVNNSNLTFCMDYWSVMDYGQFANNGFSPVGYTAYEKNFMGWLDIPVLDTRKQIVRLNALGSGGENAFRINNDSDKTGNEYYILENHQPSRWYPRVFGSGMLVLHVDYKRTLWDNNTVNTDPDHLRMTVIPADHSLVPIQDGPNSSDYKGDLFPGYGKVTSLSDTTSQNFAQYTGKSMGKYLTNITDTSKVVSFIYMARGILPLPANIATTERDDSLYASWDSVHGAGSYAVTVSAGDSVLMKSVTADTTVNIGQHKDFHNLTVSVTATASDYIDSAPSLYSFLNPTGISRITGEKKTYDVYSPAGILLRRAVSADHATDGLERGVYILRSGTDSHKVLVK